MQLWSSSHQAGLDRRGTGHRADGEAGEEGDRKLESPIGRGSPSWNSSSGSEKTPDEVKPFELKPSGITLPTMHGADPRAYA